MPARATCRLADLTWTQVEQRVRAGAWLAVPVGATEQHGPHLPLSTDTDVAVALAEALAAARDDVLVAPAVPYGSSGEHAGFAGTLSIGREATELLLVELVRSAVLTFPRVLLVVGHGGNAAPVTAAVTLLRSHGHDVLAWAPHWDGADAHAGHTETSLLHALSPDRVQVAAAEAGRTEPVAVLMAELTAGGVRAVSPNGVLGDPAGADADRGRALLDAATRALAARVRDWLGQGR